MPRVVETASARMSFEQLPAKLQQTLKQSFPHPDQFWAGLGDAQRNSLSETYNRLESSGLWKHVTRVRGEHATPEKPIGGKVKVHGSTGGLQYEVKDSQKFVQGLLKTGRFGIDPDLATMLHDGMPGHREANAPQGSLHISIGPGNRFDSHIDLVTPVNTPEADSHKANFDQERSLEHHSKEVWPEFIRKKLLVPGVYLGVGPKNADVTRSRTPQDDKTLPPPKLKDREILGSVNFVFQLAPKDNRRKLAREEDTAMVDPAVMKRAVTKGTAQVTEAELRPSGIKAGDERAGNYVDPAALASSLAGHLSRSAFDGKITAEFQLPPDYDQLSAKEREAMAAAIGRMAKAVYAELPPDAHGVRSIKLSFGTKHEYLALGD